jgi:hypothetical protein
MKLKHLLAATALMVGAAFGSAPNSGAEREWDIGQYDDCMSKTIRDPDLCCVRSGGDVGSTPGSCTAPRPDAQLEELPGRTLPPVPPDSNLPTLTEDPLLPIA